MKKRRFQQGGMAGVPVPNTTTANLNTGIKKPDAETAYAQNIASKVNSPSAPRSFSMPGMPEGQTYIPNPRQGPVNPVNITIPKQSPPEKGALIKKLVDKLKTNSGALPFMPKIPNRVVSAGQNYAKGGKVSSASSRADGIAKRGKTKGRMI